MDEDNKQSANKKRKDLKAATHILKREALRRYREKLHRRLLQEEEASQFDDKNAEISDNSRLTHDIAGPSKSISWKTDSANFIGENGYGSSFSKTSSTLSKMETSKDNNGIVFHCMKDTLQHQFSLLSHLCFN